MQINQTPNEKVINSLKNDMNDLYGRYPMIILLRHAERFQIPRKTSGSDVQLTATGLEDSKSLGKQLFYQKIGQIFSSPLIRCIDTANNILIGANQNALHIIENTVLGDPGCFVENSELCGKNFTSNGIIKTVLDFVQGKKMPGFRDLQEGAQMMKLNLINNLPLSKEKINLAISHDAIIMAFVANFISWDFSKENWHNFLEGVILFCKNNQYFLRYKGVTQKLMK